MRLSAMLLCMMSVCVSLEAGAQEVAPAPMSVEETAALVARMELVMGQAFHGAILGLETCVVFDVGDCRVAPLAGLGLGVGVSLLATTDGIKPAHAQSLNAGLLWTAVNTEWTLARSRDEDLITLGLGDGLSKNTVLWVMVGQLAGLGVGQLFYVLVDPLPGQVSLINSGGVWGVVGVKLGQGAAGSDRSWDDVAPQLAMNIGLLAGGALAHLYPMSRGRVFLMDLGGLVGMVSAVGFHMATSIVEDQQSIALAALVGIPLGIGTVAYLTRDLDDNDPDIQRRLTPTISLVPGDSLYTARGERQGGWGLSASWAW
jgi:hypothetical protein